MPELCAFGSSPIAGLDGDLGASTAQFASDPPEQPGEGRLADPGAVLRNPVLIIAHHASASPAPGVPNVTTYCPRSS